ncbi:RNA polymerase sigma factor [Acidicapsa ligni]|uniref:RNA polymerase sigma factor n=1 Tax=Acidicapsa ligni TaxID=542300 RepID=UPI0021E09C28|nr:sigma-70 family RNA polymerase sigma factor [Acidicapsa ligni]
MTINRRTEPSVQECVLSDNSVGITWLGSDRSARRVVFVTEEIDPPAATERPMDLIEAGCDPRQRILALYDEYRPKLFRYLRSMYIREDLVEEIIQETFMRLTKEMLTRESQVQHIEAWIVRVARNLGVDLLRKRHEIVIDSNSTPFVLENCPDSASSPEEVYSKKERTKKMEAALTGLRPLQRQCLQLRIQGFGYKAIGVSIGISEQRAAFIVKQATTYLAAACE